MRAISISFLGVVIMVLISACATVPTEPPAPGEVRLLGVKFTELMAIKKGLRYVVEIQFESDGEVDVSRACFYWDDYGPFCSNIMEINYGKRVIRAEVVTPAPGQYVFKSYVYYNKDRVALRSNVVQASVAIVN